MHLFRRVAVLAAVTVAPLAAVTAAAGPTSATPSAASASTCSGSPGHGIYDASTGGYVNIYQDKMIANSRVNAKQWSVYYDNQPKSPEYHEFALCDMNTGHWMTWAVVDGTTVLKVDGSSPWLTPRHSFFTDPWCGKAPDGKWLMDFQGQAGNFGSTISFNGESAADGAVHCH